MEPLVLLTLVVAGMMVFLCVFTCHMCWRHSQLWKTWEWLGYSEAQAGRGQQNIPTGEARAAYLQGWKKAFVEKAVEDAEKNV
jgi:hypothetical protein